jgi:hypothetical protein
LTRLPQQVFALNTWGRFFSLLTQAHGFCGQTLFQRLSLLETTPTLCHGALLFDWRKGGSAIGRSMTDKSPHPDELQLAGADSGS